MSKKRNNGDRSRKLEQKRKRRAKRKLAERRAPIVNSTGEISEVTVNKFSRAAWSNMRANNPNVFKNSGESNIRFNRDAWQKPDPANRPTVTEPQTGESSQ